MNIYQKTIATACLCLAALSIQAQTQVIAHRGYWKAEGSAQNSLASLRKAAEAKVYGSEFDVQMTADGIVVVNHDNTIGSTTISRATYEQIKESKLKNGETLPTLQAYLEEGRKLKDLQLILEIKKNKNKEHEDQAVKTIVKMVKDMGMENGIHLFQPERMRTVSQSHQRSLRDILHQRRPLAPGSQGQRFHRHRL